MKTLKTMQYIGSVAWLAATVVSLAACGPNDPYSTASASNAAALHLRDTAASGTVNMISGNNPPLPDPLQNAGDPNVTGINPDQYPECNYCSPSTYNSNTTANCPSVVGVPQACESYCHVPDSFNELYSTDPPTSGNHYPIPEAQLGEHVQPVQRGHYIHSMEHGAVILAYNCPQGCESELNTLRQAVQARSGHLVILTPDPLIKNGQRFAAMSWTWLYTFDTPDLDSLLCFIDQHELYGRECTDRVCVPLVGTVMQSTVPPPQ